MRYKRHRKRTDLQNTEKKPFISPGKKILAKEEPSIHGVKISSANDKKEKQADAVADKVVTRATKNSIEAQRLEDKSIVTRAPEDKEEETAAKSIIQKQEEEDISAKLEVQKQEEEEEPAAKLEIQKQEEEETNTKSFIQRKKENIQTSAISMRINAAKSGGVPLPDKIRIEMERKLNVNLGQVRIHTNEEAINLCGALKAQAFTNGYHIFFNKGKFNPESSSGKHLLAHELAHVVQQKGK